MHELGSVAEAGVQKFPWFALQVRSRRESPISVHLSSQGYECFLPMYKSTRRWSDRVREVDQPLFPGYLFCRFDLHNRGPVLMTPGIQQIVGIGRTPMPVEESEMESIRQALASGLPSQPWPYLELGQRVRVNHGSLRDLEGILINFKGSNRVVLSVSLLQRSVAMEIDLSWVIPLKEAKKTVSKVLAERSAAATILG